MLAAGAASSLSSPSFRRNSSRLNRWKTRAEKRAFQVRKIENWFSERLPRMGEKKKLVARILKSEPLILKSKPLIFHPVETALKHSPKMRTKRRHAPGQRVHTSNKHVNRPDSCRCRRGNNRLTPVFMRRSKQRRHIQGQVHYSILYFQVLIVKHIRR